MSPMGEQLARRRLCLLPACYLIALHEYRRRVIDGLINLAIHAKT
jgi:hypothetical protein